MKILMTLESSKRSFDLLPKFEHVAVSIEYSKDQDKLTIEVLMGSFQVHEQMMQNGANSTVMEQALV